MKLTIIFFGLAAGSATWWWLAYRDRKVGRASFSRSMKRGLTSLAAGAAVYFGLLLLGVLYLAITRS